MEAKQAGTPAYPDIFFGESQKGKLLFAYVNKKS